MLVSPPTPDKDTTHHWTCQHCKRAFRSNAGLASHTRQRHHSSLDLPALQACLPLQCWSRLPHQTKTPLIIEPASTASVPSAPMLVSPPTPDNDTTHHWTCQHCKRAFRSNAGLASHTRQRPHSSLDLPALQASLPPQCWSRLPHQTKTPLIIGPASTASEPSAPMLVSPPTPDKDLTHHWTCQHCKRALRPNAGLASHTRQRPHSSLDLPALQASLPLQCWSRLPHQTKTPLIIGPASTASVPSAPMLVSPPTPDTYTTHHWTCQHCKRAFRSNAGLASHTRQRPHSSLDLPALQASLPLQCWSRLPHQTKTPLIIRPASTASEPSAPMLVSPPTPDKDTRRLVFLHHDGQPMMMANVIMLCLRMRCE